MILMVKTDTFRVVISLLVTRSTKISPGPYFVPFFIYALSIKVSYISDCNTMTWICTTKLNSELVLVFFIISVW